MAKKKSMPVPPSIEARNEAFQTMSRTAQPVTAKQLSNLLVAPFKISETVLIPILDESIANGQLHSIPPATAKGKTRYWDRDLVEFARVLLVQSIQKKGPQPKAKLKTAAKGIGEEPFEQAFQSLINSQRLREHPPLGKSKVLKYSIEPPSAEPYLKDVGKQLLKIVEQLTAAGVDRSVMTDAIIGLLNQAGLPLTANCVAPDEPVIPVDRGLDLLMLMRQIEPGAERGSLVTSRELRRAANLDKPVFDNSVIELARQGKLMLHRHDHASALSPSERDELVTDGSGIYYVGMALRRTDD